MMLTITGPLSFWASSGHFKGALIKRSCEGLTAVEWSLTFWLLVARDAREKLLGKNVWELHVVPPSVRSTSNHSFFILTIMDLSDTLINGGSAPSNNTNTGAIPQEEEVIDPIWLSSRTARQIYGLCQVEKVSIRY